MDAEWLKQQFLKNPDKTKSRLASDLGLDPPAISKILAGTRQIKANEYLGMCRFFNLPEDGKGWADQHNNHRLKPLIHAGLSEQDNDSTDQEWVIPPSVLQKRTSTPPEHIKIFCIEEKVMEPHFFLGEHILIDQTSTKPSPTGAFVISDGFAQFARICEYMPSKTQKDCQIKISAPGPHFEPQILKADEVQIIGRVIAKLQWL